MKPEVIMYADLDNLRSRHSELVVDDHIESAIEELYDIAYPAKKDTKTADELADYGESLTNGQPDEWGSWFYYPWLNRVVHVPPRDEFRALRTSRNRNLVTADEQTRLYKTAILVVGMSVGSNVVEALTSQGIGGRLVLVDMDTLEPSNLNRIRAPYYHIGLQKTDSIARRIWEIDPYMDIELHEEGLTEANIVELVSRERIDIIVDEMDNLRMKVLLRESARAQSLPVLMAADDGDDTLMEIERYDLHPDLALFEGRIPDDVLHRIKSEDIPRAELGMLIGRYFVGPEHIPLRMFESLSEVGKTLPSWPQLGSAAAFSGLAVAYAAKRVILGQSLTEGRTLVSLSEKLDATGPTPEENERLTALRRHMNA